MAKPIIFSFFSGSGFLDLGFEHSNFDVRFVNEFHKPFLEAYKFSRTKMAAPAPKYGYNGDSIEDFTGGDGAIKIASLVQDAKATNDFVGFIGGPPCPDFSVGGKNRGESGENGRLTRIYVEVIVKNKPDFFLFENVKGLWRTKVHREFYDQMKVVLQNAGYSLTERLTNCIEFGAPQDRDRILLFGVRSEHLRNSHGAIRLEEAFSWSKYIKYDRNHILGSVEWPTTAAYVENSSLPAPSTIEGYQDVTVQHWFDKNDVSNHANSNHFFVPRNGIKRFAVIAEGDDGKKSYKRLHRWRYSPTAAYGNNEVHLHPYRTRRLSAAEALAIQSLPKEFCLPDNMTLTDMFKTIGNGVPYLAAKGVASTINDFLDVLGK